MIVKLTQLPNGDSIYLGANAMAMVVRQPSDWTEIVMAAPVRIKLPKRWWQVWKRNTFIACPIFHVREMPEEIQEMVNTAQLNAMRQISRELMAGITFTDRKIKPKADHLHVVEPEPEEPPYAG